MSAKVNEVTGQVVLGPVGDAGLAVVADDARGGVAEADVHMLCRLARPGMPAWSTVDDTLTAAVEAVGRGC